MQGSDSPSSLSNSLLPSDAVLKPNATIEEKLYLLSVLVPKAENAKNRVADLHAKTLATIASCAPLAAQIKEVNKYAHLFFSQMTPQLAVRALKATSLQRRQMCQNWDLSISHHVLTPFSGRFGISSLLSDASVRIHPLTPTPINRLFTIFRHSFLNRPSIKWSLLSLATNQRYCNYLVV